MADDAHDFDSLFCRAIELPSAEERVAFIAGAAGDDDELRRRLHRQQGAGPEPAGLTQHTASWR